MVADILVRNASEKDAGAISAIGKRVMPAQYAGLVDAEAVEAAVEQTYDQSAVAECITRCGKSTNAWFLAAERAGEVIGYLHFDCFGPEAELHRLYVDEGARSGGIGRLLMDALHERTGPAINYMLLVVEGNERAVRFYERQGLSVADTVDGLAYYAERMGVQFPSGTRPFSLVLMRRSGSDPAYTGAYNDE